jgi:hypothetical protein
MLMQLTIARFLASEAVRPHISVLGDETLICELLGSVLDENYQAVGACTSNKALQLPAKQSIVPSGGAVEVARQAGQIGIPMVWMTGDHAVAETNSHPVLLSHSTSTG